MSNPRTSSSIPGRTVLTTRAQVEQDIVILTTFTMKAFVYEHLPKELAPELTITIRG